MLAQIKDCYLLLFLVVFCPVALFGQYTDTTRVAIQDLGNYYEMENGYLGVHIPKSGLYNPNAAAYTPAPLRCVVYRNGTHSNDYPNFLLSNTPATGMTTAILSQTADSCVIKVSYTFDKPELERQGIIVEPAGPGYYYVTFKMVKGKKVCIVTEESDYELGFETKVSDGLNPNKGRYIGHHSSNVANGYDINGSTYNKNELVGWYATVDLGFQQRKDYPLLPRWSPWVVNSGWNWQLYNSNGGATANTFGIFDGQASKLLGAQVNGTGLFTDAHAVRDVHASADEAGLCHLVWLTENKLYYKKFNADGTFDAQELVTTNVFDPFVFHQGNTVNILAFDPLAATGSQAKLFKKIGSGTWTAYTLSLDATITDPFLYGASNNGTKDFIVFEGTRNGQSGLLLYQADFNSTTFTFSQILTNGSASRSSNRPDMKKAPNGDILFAYTSNLSYQAYKRIVSGTTTFDTVGILPLTTQAVTFGMAVDSRTGDFIYVKNNGSLNYVNLTGSQISNVWGGGGTNTVHDGWTLPNRTNVHTDASGDALVYHEGTYNWFNNGNYSWSALTGGAWDSIVPAHVHFNPTTNLFYIIGKYQGKLRRYSYGGSGNPTLVNTFNETDSPTAGIRSTHQRIAPNGNYYPDIRFQWVIFADRQQFLKPADQVNDISIAMHKVSGLAEKWHTYLNTPAVISPAFTNGGIYVSSSEMQAIITKIKTDDPFYNQMKLIDPYLIPVMDAWRDNSPTKTNIVYNTIVDFTDSLRQEFLEEDGIYSYYEQYVNGGRGMLRHTMLMAGLMADTKLTTPQRDTLKKYVALYARILWDNDFVPFFTGHGLNLGTENMPIQYQGFRWFFALLLKDDPAFTNRAALVSPELTTVMDQQINNSGAARGTPHYLQASLDVLMLTALQLKNANISNLFQNTPKLKKLADFLLHLQTPKSVRFSNNRKLICFGDGNEESAAIFGFMATGFFSIDSVLAKRLMYAYRHGPARASDYGFVTMSVNHSMGEQNGTGIGSAHFPGYLSTFRSALAASNESATWFINGDWYTDHRNDDRGALAIYALGAPLSLNYGTLYNPEQRAGFMKSIPVQESRFPEWDDNNQPFMMDDESTWNSSQTQAYMAFKNSGYSKAKFTGDTQWTRHVFQFTPKVQTPVFIIKDEFTNTNLDHVWSMNFVSRDVVQTPSGAVDPPAKFWNWQGSPKENPSPSSGISLSAGGFHRFDFTGINWIAHPTNGINWEVYMAPNQAHTANLAEWAHNFTPNIEKLEYQATNNVSSYEERQIMMRVKGKDAFYTVIVPYNKGQRPAGLSVTKSGASTTVQTNDFTFVTDLNTYTYTETGRNILSTYTTQSLTFAGATISGNPMELEIKTDTIYARLHGTAGNRQVTLPSGSWVLNPTSPNATYNNGVWTLNHTYTDSLNNSYLGGYSEFRFLRGVECTNLTSPANGATNVAVTAALTWAAAAGSPTGYRLDVGTSSGGTQILNNYDAGNVTTYNPPGDFPGATTIYVKIKPYNAVGSAVGCTEESFTTSSGVPTCTNLTSPANGATNVAVTSGLTWSPAPGSPTGYRLDVGITPGGTQILNNYDVGNVTTFNPAGDFPFLTPIYVTIRAYNASGSATGCVEESFTTQIPPPACTNLTSPANGATNVAVTAALTWAAATGSPTGYRLDVGTTSGGTQILNNHDVGNVLTFNPAGDFPYNTTIYVKVKPYNGTGSASGCTEQSFTTQIAPPACTSLTSPANGATNVAVTAVLTWAAASGSPTGYRLDVGTTSGGTQILNNVDVGNVLTFNPAGDFPYNTTIYVKIKPYNGTGSASGCTEQSFTTQIAPPACTNLTSPANGATNVAVTTALTWSAASGSPTGYRLDVGTTSGGTQILNNFDVGNVTTYNPAGDFPFNTTIYVKIKPYNGTGSASGCTEQSFTTQIAPPACTNLTSPANGATNIEVTAALTWAAATGSPTGYRLDVGTTSGGTQILNNVDVGNVTTYNPAGDFPYGTVIYVKVKPYNGTGSASGCTEQSFTTESGVPGCTNLTSPANGATNVAVTAALSWAGAAGSPTGYRLDVGTNPGGQNILNNFDVGNVTTYNPAGDFPYNTTIYVTVKPYNANGTASGCPQESFMTQIPPPACTNLTSPANGATNVAVTAALTWAAASGSPTGYRLDVGTTSGGTQILNNVDVGNVTSYNPAGDFPYNTTIYVKVKPYNGTGSASGCTEQSFTTQIAPPACTNLTSPANGATNVAVTAALTWAAATGSPTGYRLDVGTTSGGTQILNNVDVGNVTTYNPAGDFPYNTTIYVKIKPYNGTGSASGCTEQSFTTQIAPPACTNLTSPANGATNVAVTTALTWSAASGSPTGYRLDVGTTSGGTQILNNFDVGNVTTYNPAGDFPFNTTIYVTVKPYNGTGSSSGCTEQSFTTQIAPPACTSLTSPANGATNVAITAALTWAAASGSPTGYRLDVGTTSGGTQILNNVDVGNVTTYNPAGDFPYGSVIYVKVKPYNGTGSSSGCTEQSFTTQIAPPACTSLTSPANGATNVAVTAALTWAAASGSPTGYRLDVGTTSGGTQILNNVDVGNVTTYNPAGDFPYGSVIYVKVKPYNGTGSSSGCTEQSFTTQIAPPACTSLSSPANGATNVAVTAVLTWAAASGSPTGYRLDVGTTSGGTQILNNVDVGNVTSYDPAGDFPFNTTIYVKIKPYNGTGSASSCTEQSFTTQVEPSACTNLTSPANSATNVAVTTALNWAAASGAPTGYRLDVGTSPGGMQILNNFDVGNVTTYNPGGDFPFNTTIYVKIKPYNSSGSATGCVEESFTTQIAPPACTSLTSPANGATNVAITAALTWSAASGSPTGYRLDVGTTSGGTQILNNVDVGNVTSYNPAGDFPFNTTIYVKIKPYNGTGSASGCTEQSFTTQISPPACTNLTSPANGATNVAVTAALIWAAASGSPTGYRLDVGTTSGGTQILNNVDVGNVTSYNPAGDFPFNTTIYVKIKPYNGTGSASGCTEQSFTTQIAPPACTNLTSPANGATNVAVTTALTWAAASGSPTGYRLDVGTTSGGTQILNNVDVGNVTTYNLAGDFPYNTTIYVTVKPYNGTGSASGCTEQSFTTQIAPPACTNLTSPANGATNIEVTAALTWAAATGSPTGYRLDVGTTSGGTQILNNVDVGNVTSYNPAGDFPYGTVIYVKIKPYNGTGSASGCTEQSFTTQIAPPACTSLTSPPNGATNVAITAALTWAAASGSPTGYRLDVGTTSGGTDILNNVDVGNVTTYNPAGNFPLGTTIYVKIKPYNATGSAVGCQEESFSTQLCIPNLTVNNQMIPSGTYQSEGDLTSTVATVAINENVIFKSDTGILLESIFTVQLGATFEAVIEPCANNIEVVIPGKE